MKLPWASAARLRAPFFVVALSSSDERTCLAGRRHSSFGHAIHDPGRRSRASLRGRTTIVPVLRRPGGEIASRPLCFFWLADCSGSMAHDGKIQALNNAAREALPHMRDVAAGNPHARPLLRVMRFATGAEWVTPEAIAIEDFSWPELQAGGVTSLGAALGLLARELQSPTMPQRALPPVLVLVSDGQPTDDFEAGLAALGAAPWGAKAVRLGIAIGRDADHEVLARFIADPAVPILEANAPEALVRQMRWASTIGLASASSPTITTELRGEALAAESSPEHAHLLTLAGVSYEALRAAAADEAASTAPTSPPGVGGNVLPGSQADEIEIW